MDAMKLLVIAEQQNGKLHRASWEAVAAAQVEFERGRPRLRQ